MTVLLLFAATFAATGAAVDQMPAAAAARFARLDRNRDGVITANEAPRVVRTRCECLGAAGPQPAAGGWLAGFDRDGDARITAEEFAARSADAAEPDAADENRVEPPLR